MSFYRVSMDAKLEQWAEITAIVEANTLEAALQKAKNYDFKDIKVHDVYDSCIHSHDEGEGITIEELL